MPKENQRNDLEYAFIHEHKMHIFRTGNEDKPALVFMSGSATAAPMYDFKILYGKLLNDFRVIVIEKFGYGYSDLYEAPCDIDSVVSFQRQALEKIGEKGPFILAPHSMSGLEAVRWAQKYPDEIMGIIGLDMAVPQTYLNWGDAELNKRIGTMKTMRKLNDRGLLFWYPLNTRGLDRDEIKEQRLLFRRNAMNNCWIMAAEAVRKNAETVSVGGRIQCPVLMFVSDGKQVSANWIDYEREFGNRVNAELIDLKCGHYVHYYESEQISRKMKEFADKI